MDITKSKDYIEKINLLFPDVSKDDIKKIMDYGWRLLYLLNSYGGDLIIKDNNFWSYIGMLTPDSMKHFRYYCRKLARRIRILYHRKKISWNGYYYFGLTDKLWENYESLKHSKGRPRKKFKFGTIKLYKIKDECLVSEWACGHIFRVPFISEIGMTSFQYDYITDKAELIEIRDKPKFKDILITNNNYNVLK